MTEYRWSSPYEWLHEEIDSMTDAEALRDIAKSLAAALDNDEIQDIFQAEMDADDYFKPLA